MGPGFLIDTNILVYYYEGLIPVNAVQELDEIFRQSFNISIISKIEFLGWPKYDEEQEKKGTVRAIVNQLGLDLKELEKI